MNSYRRKYGAWLVSIIIVLTAFVAFNVLCVSNFYANAVKTGDVVPTANRFFTVDGIEGLSELKKAYFNGNVTSANDYKTASYEGDRWIIVEFDGDTLYDAFGKSGYASFSEYCATDAADKLKNNIDEKHAEFLSELDENEIEYRFKYSYSTFNNGVAVKVNSGAYNVIRKMSGVKNAYFSERYAQPKVATVNDANVYTTGIYDSSDLDYKGEGMVVAILDTGLDYSHEAFRNMPADASKCWSKEDVARKMAASTRFNAKATADEVYYNLKVPFAYDYADDDPDVYPSYSTHGTHVAGIVGGKSDYVVNEATGEKFIGVAPEAQLVICKVFTDNLDSDSLGGADTTDILAAVSDCAELGVDVINMSLGSSAGFADEKSNTVLNEIYARVKQAGISLVVAASNDYSSGFGGGNGTNLATNPDSATVGSPSTYDAALSVASINGQKATYIQANNDENQVAFITTSSDENGNEYKFTELLYRVAGKDYATYEGNLNFKYVVIGGVGRATNYNAAIKREINNKEGYDGVIALVKRGDTTFAEKVQTAMNNGVDACIIYNNVSGTIRMSLGEVEDPVPTCSISMDAGKIFVDNAVRNVGTIQINKNFMAGPFMSEFSSWGPLPDLQLKPEITAHGGEITSAVPGGYDIYSGTSMASPNMAGAVSLLRQYLKESNPGLTGTELTARVNQVLMSTATIANNEEGNPYSPRKQGAGLAGIYNAIHTESYITVLDAEGKERDKTKIELFDDKKKTGEYVLDFVINNISGKTEYYDPKTYVMTETLASDNKTVAEKAHMLDDSDITYYVNGTAHSGKIEVPANAKLSVKIVIKLSAAAKQYIETGFTNGMYVEGFVSLAADGAAGTKVTIGLPYLAFYGDWNDGPLFDYDAYELAESQKDTGVPEEDKLKASAAETRPLGRYFDDQYIIALGSYLYSMDESEVQIYPERDKAAVSMFDTKGQRTIYEMYMVYAGLLRNAAYMTVTVTDAATGNVVYSERQENVSKSYAAGGGNRGAIIMMEMKPSTWGLANNNTYLVSLKGELEGVYGQERDEKVTNPERGTFDFRFTVDYEAPQILDYRIRFDSYKDENKQIKYKIYMDVDVFDNQYVMDVMPCYIKQDKGGKNVLTLATKYPVPVYGGKGETSTVSFEITDIYEDYVKTGKLYLAVDDYAMNQTTYAVSAPAAIDYPDEVILATDEKLVDTGRTGKNTSGDGAEYRIYELSLAPNEVYKPSVAVTPASVASRSLSYYVKSGSSYVKANEEEIFGSKNGIATVYLCDVEDSASQTIYARIDVTVEGQAKQLPRLNKITLEPVANGKDYVVNFDGTLPSFEMYPNQTIQFKVKADPWYLSNISYEWKSANPSVASVDKIGNITSHKKGTAMITVSVVGNATASKSVSVTVGDEYRIINYTLYDYYGGENVEIPESKNIMYLDEECFQYNTTVKRIVFPSTLTEIPKEAFKGCTNLEEIVVPGQCIVIHKEAFKDCAKLNKITFGKFVDKDKVEHPEYTAAITIGDYAFSGCTSLATIENSKRLTTVGNGAFEKCTSLETIDISELRVTGKGVFKGCTKLSNVITDENTNIGEDMFSGCSALRTFDFSGAYISAGAFGGTGLTEFNFTDKSQLTGIGQQAFASTLNLISITLPAGSYAIESGAFSGSGLQTVVLDDNADIKFGTSTPFTSCDRLGKFIVADGSVNYSAGDGSTVSDLGVLYNKDKTELIAVPTGKTVVKVLDSVTKIRSGALSGLSGLTAFDASGATEIGNYAFAGSSVTEVTLSEELTSLPEGVFSGCYNLTKVSGVKNVTVVGSNAFKDCGRLTSVDMPKVEEAGDYAFANCGIRAFVAPHLKKAGNSAFRESKITEANFPELTVMGERAFSNISALTSVIFGGVTEMGDYAFYNSNNIVDATFGDGTTKIGDYAFASATKRETLTDVTLPDGVTYIGTAAFMHASNLTSINLSGVKTVEAFAFRYAAKLSSARLSGIEHIGARAFESTAFTAADLAAAKYVGEYAFLSVPLTSVTFNSLKVVGIGAFVDTKLTTVTLPASFNDRNYVYSWDKLDEKGRVEETRYRNEPSYGAGAFSYIDTLKEIRVAEGNEGFKSIDGVLYSVVKVTENGQTVEKGLVLEQYPTAKEGQSYVVADNTLEIGAYSFEGVSALEKITFPYTVKSIGSYAFFDSTVNDYTFNSVQAPALKAEYVDASVYKNTTLQSEYFLYQIFGTDSGVCIGGTVYYANFYDYVGRRLYADSFASYEAPSFGLKVTYPKNGKGYDTVIWKNFFETVTVTDEILPEDTTHEAIAAIDKISSVMSNEAIAAAPDMASLNEIIEAVKQARLAYNKITSTEQLALVADKNGVLLAAEKALRDKKAALGYPVNVDRIELAQIPTKIQYTAGERFDPTGMAIKVIYEDSSEVLVSATETVIDKTVLAEGNEYVTVTYTERGQSYSVQVFVNVVAGQEEKPVNPDDKGGKDGLSTGAIVGISVGCGLAVLAGVAVAVILILRKKKIGIFGKVKTEDIVLPEEEIPVNENTEETLSETENKDNDTNEEK